MDPRNQDMTERRCTNCGSAEYETRKVEYLYSYQGSTC